MKRIVFYTGTRNFYHMMTLSLKSMLDHTRIDKVYFIIEDDTFTEPLPDCVECVNVSNQQYFRKDGPNYRSKYSHIILMRVALPLMFPDIDTALCIDADTLILDDISGIWKADITDRYFAAAKELRNLYGYEYYNFGVVLMNFDKLRADHIPEQAIEILNTRHCSYPEQDVMNELCRGHICRLPSEFNHVPNVTTKSANCTIRHYVGMNKNPMLRDAEPYEHIQWNELTRPVLFASARPLERAENLKPVYDAYPGKKHFEQVPSSSFNAAIKSGKYDVMVIDEFPLASPGKTIMIWHAIQGGKHIGLDQPQPYYQIKQNVLMNYVITGSTGTVDMFAHCTGVPRNRVLPYGNPSSDAYAGKKKGDGGTFLAGKRAYLFVPTFRNGNETPFPEIDWSYLDAHLTDDEILAVKFHPYRDFIRVRGEYKHIVPIPSSEPSAPYLYDCDVVITDYSSIMFSGYLLGKPCVLFEPKQGYLNTRGMYLNYPDQYSSRYCRDEKTLIELMRSADGLTQTEHDCLKIVADACDGHATERIIDLINRLNR